MKEKRLLGFNEATIPFSKLTFKQRMSYVIEIFLSGLPTVSAYLTPTLANLISLYFLSRYGDDKLVGGYGLGAMYSSIFAISWINSFNQAANVFISQAFGAQDYHACGVYFRRGIIIHILLLIPLSICLVFADKVMMLCGVEESLASNAVIFTKFSIPFTLGSACFDSMKSFIMGQRVFRPILFIQMTTLLLHFVWVNVFIEWLHLGIIGAVICRTVEEWSNSTLMYIYIQKSGKFRLTWGNWSRELLNFEELLKQFKFAFSIAISSYIIWIYYEVLTLLAGTFDARQVVIHIAIANTSSLEYSISMAMAVTLITLIGNSLGERNLTKAKNYVYAGHTLLIMLTLVFLACILAFQYQWASFWSQDPETQKSLLYGVKAYIFGCMLVDGINNGLIATLKSVGKEKVTISTTLFSLYGIGIPCIILFGFILDLKVFGIWVAFGIGSLILVFINFYALMKVDWSEVMRDIDHKLKSAEKQKPIELEKLV